MRTELVLVSLLILTACEKRSADFSDADLKQIRAENPGMTETCFRALRREGMSGWPDSVDGCFEMLPAKRWGGVWNTGWEWSNFCQSPARDCPVYGEPGVMTMEFAPGAYNGPDISSGLYAIEFVGRRTAKPGGYGHLGQYSHAIVVDRIVSLKKIEDRSG